MRRLTLLSVQTHCDLDALRICALLGDIFKLRSAPAVSAIWTRQTRKQVKVGDIPMALTACHNASVLIYSQQPPYPVLSC